MYGFSSLINCCRLNPRVRRVMSRICALNLSRAFGAMRRSLPSFEMLNAFDAALAPWHRSEWVVFAKQPFAGPGAVLAYLARYTPASRSPTPGSSPSMRRASPSDGRTIGSKGATGSRP